MRYINRTENPNTFVGIFLLLLLAVFAGPTVLPELLSENIAFVDEGVSCGRLPSGEDRAIHQSALGRAVSEEIDPPLTLSVRTTPVPNDGTQNFSISVIVTNNTIATIPILVNAGTLIFDPNSPQNGLGVSFNNAAPVPQAGENVTTYSEERIRILGPRQTCVHRVTLAFNTLPNPSALTAGNSTIKAFYRNTTRGTAVPGPGDTAIYTDQGLWTGVVESGLETIPVGSQ